MAFWNPLSYKSKKVMREFGDGVNTFVPPMNIKDSQLTDSLNMCSDSYPDIRTRNDRVPFAATALTSSPYAFGQRNNEHLHVVDGPDWKYWNTTGAAYVQLSSAMLKQQGQFVEMNTPAKRYTILANNNSSAQIPYAYDGTTTLVSLTSNAPHSALYTVNKRRLWGVDNDGVTLQFSALSNPADWVTALDAGSIVLSAIKGPATAITTFQDHVVLFSENSMHEIYGNEPLNFTVVDISNEIGCVNFRSVVECRGKLFWLDRAGIYTYTGGTPKKVSEAVTKWIDKINWTYGSLISAGNGGDKIYFAIPYDGSTVINRILVYDTYKNKWFIEDGDYFSFVNISDNTLYGLEKNKQIYDVNSTGMTGLDNSTSIAWNFITKAYNDFAVSQQNGIKDMWIEYSGSTNATMTVSYTTNATSTAFTTLIPSSDVDFSTSMSKFHLPLPTSQLQTQDVYKLKFSGTGQVTVHGVEINQVSWGG